MTVSNINTQAPLVATQSNKPKVVKPVQSRYFTTTRLASAAALGSAAIALTYLVPALLESPPAAMTNSSTSQLYNFSQANHSNFTKPLAAMTSDKLGLNNTNFSQCFIPSAQEFFNQSFSSNFAHNFTSAIMPDISSTRLNIDEKVSVAYAVAVVPLKVTASQLWFTITLPMRAANYMLGC